MDLIMETTFGKDWGTLFDLKCAHTNKPDFFRNDKQFFHTIDFDKPNFKQIEITDASQLEHTEEYLEGNAFMVH